MLPIDYHLKNALMLEVAHAKAIATSDPIHKKHAFDCANSFRECNRHEDAIRWYKITLKQENSLQEKYLSCLHMYKCCSAIGQREHGIFYLVKSFTYDMERVECLYELVEHYCCDNMSDIAYTYYNIIKPHYIKLINDPSIIGSKLHFNSNVANFFLPYYMIIVADRVNDRACGVFMYKVIFQKKQCVFSEWHLNNLFFNLRFFISHVSPEFVSIANEYLSFLLYNGVNSLNFKQIANSFEYGGVNLLNNSINANPDKHPKICFITAVYGNYEKSCKRFAKQTVDTDFICFTDNKNIISNGWIIETNPYHLTHKSPLDDSSFTNSLINNKHNFNVAKYYKQSFANIPRLQKYDVVVWLDGTIEIIYDKTSEYILSKIHKEKIVAWHHEYRHGELKKEVDASHFYRYTSTHWNNQDQPYQDIDKQYNDYIQDGYTDDFFKQIQPDRIHFGVWITCFVAFLQHDPAVRNFLKLWYLQTLKHTTQDQIGFPYVCQKTNLIPYTLPDNDVHGEPHQRTMFYIKHDHGK